MHNGISPFFGCGRGHCRYCRARGRLFGAVQARQYHDELFAILDLIATSPRLARERLELAPPMRIHPFKAHLVVYRIEADGDVFIVRVRHGHEDWANEGTR